MLKPVKIKLFSNILLIIIKQCVRIVQRGENSERAINVIVDGIHKFCKNNLAKFQLRSMLLSHCGALHGCLVIQYESIKLSCDIAHP